MARPSPPLDIPLRCCNDLAKLTSSSGDFVSMSMGCSQKGGNMKIRLALLAMLGVLAAWAQVGSSTISGRVVDATGAVVANVSVSAVQLSTNFTFNAVTNND